MAADTHLSARGVRASQRPVIFDARIVDAEIIEANGEVGECGHEGLRGGGDGIAADGCGGIVDAEADGFWLHHAAV